MGNEGDNVDIHVDAIPSHRKMRGSIGLIVKGINIDKIKIRINLFVQTIRNNANHFSSF